MKITLVTIFILSFLSSCASKNPQNSRYLGTLWAQKSAEAHAIYHQTFQMAKRQLVWKKKRYSGSKRPAVVLDVDETVLDNSPFQGKLWFDKKVYNKVEWDKWIARHEAKALPGAKEFIDFAKKMGVDVYYITNRKIHNFDPTFLNLKKEKLIDKKSQLIMRTVEKSKEARRKKLQKTHDVLLYLGDNLGDHHESFEHGSSLDRNKAVEKLKHKLGIEYIMFPNPMYGAWERKAGEVRGY